MTERNGLASSAPFFALGGLACALLSAAWVGGFLNFPFFGVAVVNVLLASAIVLTVGANVGWMAGKEASNWFLRRGVSLLVAAPIIVVGLFISANATGMIGAYAVSPPFLGLVLAVAAVALSLAARRRDRNLTVASAAIAIFAFVVAAQIVLRDAPGTTYAAVRKFAAAAYRGDQETLKSMLSSSSLTNIEWLGDGHSVVVHPFHGGKPAAIVSFKRTDGDIALMDCGVPKRGLSPTTFAGSNFTVYLIRENGEWKVDALRTTFGRWTQDSLREIGFPDEFVEFGRE